MNYSIIIPHHNIPLLLARCLQSIPHRADLQVLVVDDNSGPAEREKLREMEKIFPWVTFLYTTEGRGAGYARNVALRHATGRYLLFSDADDYFNYCLQEVLDDYANASFDIVYFAANSVDSATNHNASRAQKLNRLIRLCHQHPDKGVFLLKYTFGEPWCKMVRRDIVENNGIHFDELPYHNDTRFSYLVGHYSNNVYVDNRAIYCVVDRENSVIKKEDMDHRLVTMRVLTAANRFYQEHHIAFYDYSVSRQIWHFLLQGQRKALRQYLRACHDEGITNTTIIARLLRYPFFVLANPWKIKDKIYAQITQMENKGG